MAEVTSKEIAEALAVPPRTVVYWINKKDLPAWKPFDSDRAGFRTTVGDVRTWLAAHANDGGRALERFNRWVTGRFQDEIQTNTGNNRKGVLLSK